MIVFRRRLDGAIPEPRARVRAVARSEDPTARLSVTHAAFGVERSFDRYVEEYRRFMRSPAYPEGWDLVAETEDGIPAACCIAWPDTVSRSGNFEPVATHPDHARQGYGTAVMSDGLRRLAASGMRWAIVRTLLGNVGAQMLYRSLGFEEWHRQPTFVRSAGRP